MAERAAEGAVAARTMASPGVRMPPPVVYAAALGVAWLLQREWPLPFLAHGLALEVGIPLAAIGSLLALTSVVAMLRGRGTLNTNGRSAALVEAGPYRFSRNPMYVALVVMYSGAACALGLLWGFLLLPLLVVYTQTLVIAREERYLAGAFGQAWTEYAARARRWL